jgi:hypothetical protein
MRSPMLQAQWMLVSYRLGDAPPLVGVLEDGVVKEAPEFFPRLL